jgi:hypothetical protein
MTNQRYVRRLMTQEATATADVTGDTRLGGRFWPSGAAAPPVNINSAASRLQCFRFTPPPTKSSFGSACFILPSV